MPGPPGEVSILRKLEFPRTPLLVTPAFMFGLIFLDSAGMGDTLATLDNTDMFVFLEESLETLGEESIDLSAAVGWLLCRRDCDFIRNLLPQFPSYAETFELVV